ncbi:voltage-gated potassium channel Kch [Labrenzia sp. EL_13]|nr:voltage-gated potassium channel Kch [Labrenzia sp. EL_13]
MSRLFLSHSSLDNAAAVALGNWLTASGWDDHFLDLDPAKGIAAGERWERALHAAANRCEAVLFLVSQNWLASEWCSKEFDLATRLNKRLFGVLVDPDLEISKIPVRFTDTWQFANLASGQDHETFRAVVPPDDEEVHVTFSNKGLTHLKRGLNAAGLDPKYFSWPPVHDPNRAPYRGLPPLEAEDAGIFFGREAPIVAALDRLRSLSEKSPPRLFVVLGASGAGKSSFLRAGLLPLLHRDDRHFYALPVVRPGGAVLNGESGFLESLFVGLQNAGVAVSRDELAKTLHDPDAVINHLAALAEKRRVPAMVGEAPSRDPALVIPVDQAEELFQSEGHDQSDTFLKLLRAISLSQTVRVVVVFTIRTDRYEELQTASALKGDGTDVQPLQQETFSLPPIPRGSYHTIIEGPARRLSEGGRSLEIDPKLTAMLLSDIEEAGGRDALPLLAFVLQRLWQDHGGKGKLKLEDYLGSRGLAGAIEAGVEKAFQAAAQDPSVPQNPLEREALLRRGLIPWLTGIDPATNEPRRNVARLTDIPEETRPLIRHLVDARLLSVHMAGDTDVPEEAPAKGGESAELPDIYTGPLSGEAYVEPAHEALLRQWELLRNWLKEDLTLLAALEGVLAATRDWLANDRDEGWLVHTKGRLDEAEELHQRPDLAERLGAEERDYLNRCRAIENERRNKELADAKQLAEEQQKRAEAEGRGRQRARRGLVAASIAAALAIAAAGGATWFWQEAQQQTKIAEKRMLQYQVQVAGDLFRKGEFFQSGTLIADALKKKYNSSELVIQVESHINYFSENKISIENDKKKDDYFLKLPKRRTKSQIDCSSVKEFIDPIYDNAPIIDFDLSSTPEPRYFCESYGEYYLIASQSVGAGQGTYIIELFKATNPNESLASVSGDLLPSDNWIFRYDLRLDGEVLEFAYASNNMLSVYRMIKGEFHKRSIILNRNTDVYEVYFSDGGSINVESRPFYQGGKGELVKYEFEKEYPRRLGKTVEKYIQDNGRLSLNDKNKKLYTNKICDTQGCTISSADGHWILSIDANDTISVRNNINELVLELPRNDDELLSAISFYGDGPSFVAQSSTLPDSIVRYSPRSDIQFDGDRDIVFRAGADIFSYRLDAINDRVLVVLEPHKNTLIAQVYSISSNLLWRDLLDAYRFMDAEIQSDGSVYASNGNEEATEKFYEIELLSEVFFSVFPNMCRVKEGEKSSNSICWPSIFSAENSR